jgi:crossover junction endodeoxyribonuclease RuvC
MNAPMLPTFDTPLVVGLDPSLTASGIAWPDGHTVAYGVAGLTGQGPPLGERGAKLKGLVVNLGNRVFEHAERWPVLAMIEELPRVHLDSERAYVWWSIVNLLEAQGCTCVQVQPAQLKIYALGTSRTRSSKDDDVIATKGAVIDALARRLPQFASAGSADRADAAWLCAMGLDVLGYPLAPMPEAHRRALDKIKLPASLLAVAR